MLQHGMSSVLFFVSVSSKAKVNT